MANFFQIIATPLLIITLLIGGAQYWARTAPEPLAIGPTAEGLLRACESPGNCVTSVPGGADAAEVQPFRCGAFTGPTLLGAVRNALTTLPNITVVTEEDGYIHAVQRSDFWGFPDDVELLLDHDVVDVRSQSRRGSGDLGVNRSRVESMHTLLDKRCGN